MKRWILAAAAALPAWTVLVHSGFPRAQEPLQITGYIDTAGKVNVYDRDGNPLGKRPVSELPPPPVQVLEANEDRGMYRIRIGQDEVWVTRTSARLNRSAGVLTTCQRAERVGANPPGPTSRGLSSCLEGQ